MILPFYCLRTPHQGIKSSTRKSPWVETVPEFNQPINRPITHSINQSIERRVDQSINQSIEESINQSIEWWPEKSINQSRMSAIKKLNDKKLNTEKNSFFLPAKSVVAWTGNANPLWSRGQSLRTRRWTGSFRMSNAVDFCSVLISRSATVLGRNLYLRHTCFVQRSDVGDFGGCSTGGVVSTIDCLESFSFFGVPFAEKEISRSVFSMWNSPPNGERSKRNCKNHRFFSVGQATSEKIKLAVNDFALFFADASSKE